MAAQELEAAQSRLEEETRKLKGAAASSAAAVESLTARLEETGRAAAAARKQRDSEVSCLLDFCCRNRNTFERYSKGLTRSLQRAWFKTL